MSYSIPKTIKKIEHSFLSLKNIVLNYLKLNENYQSGIEKLYLKFLG